MRLSWKIAYVVLVIPSPIGRGTEGEGASEAEIFILVNTGR